MTFDPFRFVFMADCQFGCYATFSGLDADEVAAYADRGMAVASVPPVDGFAWDADRYREAVGAANRIGPAFVVMGGDMVDDAADPDQYDALMAITGDLTMPMHWVPGNHDVAWDAVSPTADALASYRHRFGPDRFAFRHNDVAFVVIDTPVWIGPEALPDEAADHVAWLERVLGEARRDDVAHIIAFGHHPPFTTHPDEDDSYWNLPRDRRTLLLDLLDAHDATAMLCGHWHRNGGGRVGDLEVVVSGPVGYPLGADPSGLRIVDVTADGITHEYVPLDQA